MSPFLVSPISGWRKRPSQISSAALVRYSCARWIGLRVWKATIRFQPRSANALLRLLGGQVAAHERLVVVGQRVGLDLAGDAAVALLADRGDAGMLVVGRAVDLLGLELDVALEDLADGQAAERLAVRRGQLDDVALGAVEVGRERDRDRPDLAAGEAHVLARPSASPRSP